MKKNIRRYISVMLTIAVFFTGTAFGASGNYTPESGGEKVKAAVEKIEAENALMLNSEKMKAQGVANEQYNALLKEIKDESKSEAKYADFYGGAYINEDDKLVVCVTDSSAADKRAFADVTSTIRSATKNPEIIIEKVKYPLNALLDTQSEIVRIKQMFDGKRDADWGEYAVMEYSISSYTDEVKNRLVVGIRDLDDEKIAEYKKLFPNTPFIEFEEAGIIETTAEWRPGQKIYIKSGSPFPSLSTGYPVYFTNNRGEKERGFITAGHSFTPDVHSEIYTRDTDSISYRLGVHVDSQFSGSVDAALIRITKADYSISTTSYYHELTLLVSPEPSLAVNTIVYKEGATTGATIGVVESTSEESIYEDTNIILTDMLKTSALNLKGDSGGVMYARVGSGDYFVVIGSMSGSKRADGTPTLTEQTFECSYVCKKQNAVAALGCTLS